MPDSASSASVSLRDAFIRAAVAPRADGASHASGDLIEANALLSANPSLAIDLHCAATLGDAETIEQLLTHEPALASSRGGPYNWDPLTHLCFSRYLRLDPARGDGFVRAASALLHAGASARTGFFDDEHEPTPMFESVLYGAAGIAHHEALTRLLLAHGADPNDIEVAYHAPESYDLGAFRALIETGALNADSLNVMLLRKSDWHHVDGMALVLSAGADPNQTSRWGRAPLAHAIRSDNSADIIAMLVSAGADPLRPDPEVTPYVMAAWAGRDDLLTLFDRHVRPPLITGIDALVAACARADANAAHALVQTTPELLHTLQTHTATLLARFAGIGNRDGLELLLDLGLNVDTPNPEANGYFELAAQSTALHVAAWRARHSAVRLLLDRGANPSARDARHRTPLMLAILACVQSYWMDRRSPDSVHALLAAGASLDGVRYPCGYEAVDTALAAAGASATTTML
jgi:ankyrin repeat protein